MRVLDIGKFESSIVLHFDTEDTRINAYTFASTLVALADAAKAANASVNPGCEIEVVVEALGLAASAQEFGPSTPVQRTSSQTRSYLVWCSES